MEREELRARVTAGTMALTALYNYYKGIGKEEADYDPKAIEIAEYIHSHSFGCKTGVVIGLVELILGLKLPSVPDLSEHIKNMPEFAAFVLERNTNDHDYKLGITCVNIHATRNGCRSIQHGKWGKEGNNPDLAIGSFRPATPEEYNMFVDKIPVEDIEPL